VAIVLPTAMREIQVSCRHSRGASIMGRIDLKAQPKT
jgi:hypothetical protein